MEERGNNRQYVRQLKLPSGRRIEVVYFEDRRSEHSDAELHICGTCDSRLVYPIDWAPVGKTYWQVTLRCPNCEWAGTGVYEQAVVDRFDVELDAGTEVLRHGLERLALENMNEEIERFAAALASDQILPSDF
jgi:hypothetical protein